MIKFSKKTRTTIVVMKARGGFNKRVLFTSFEGTVDYEEAMPGFHTPGWAAWCAFRLLHPVVLHEFETEIRKLFEEFKRGGRNWITYNEEKRALLAQYLQRPYAPGKRK